MTKIRFKHSEEDSEKSAKSDTPQSTKNKVRSLIEEEGLHSTTEIADRLNGFLPGATTATEPRFPRASGHVDSSPWKAADVSSLLRSSKMEDLKARLVANKPKVEVPVASTLPGGVSPLEFRQALADDLAVLLKQQGSKLDCTISSFQNAIEQLRRDVANPASEEDLALARKAIAGALEDVTLAGGESVVADTADEVCKVFEEVIAKSDLPAVKRMSEAAAENVGEVLKKIDDLTAELFDTLKTGLDESAITISEIVVEQVNSRLAAFMGEVKAAVDEQVTATITAAIDKGLGQIQNSFASQHQHVETAVKRTVLGLIEHKIAPKIDGLSGRVSSRFDSLDQRLKKMEDAEADWND